jgi:putative phosphoesterase
VSRIAVVSDVHGNLPALEAVLAEVEAEGFDVVVSCGDVVAGPMEAACLDRLAALGDRIRWVRGNADREVLEAGRLGPAHRDLLASFALTVEADGVLLCHGTPRSDEEIVTPRTSPERLAEILAGVETPVVVGGHVHMQFVQRSGSTQWVNAGSAGMPYEGAPGAYWLALVDGVPDPRRTDYDLDAAEAAIRATGSPDADSVVDAIRGRVTREEAMDAFEPR